MSKTYALYKGEECLAIGTIKEIAKVMGVKERSIRFYATPTYQKRNANSKIAKIVIKIDDEDEDE